MGPRPRVVVVGGGIAGLAAAHRLRQLGPDADIVVLERADRLGGKLHTAPLGGCQVETGAEAFLCYERGSESPALALCHEVGLGDALVHPASLPAALALDGALRSLPHGTLMGIPADPEAVRGIAAVTDKDDDTGQPLLKADEDTTAGALVRARLGDEVVDRLVDPLLGGVYAGRADELSVQATMPGLHRAAQVEHTLTAAVRRAITAAARPQGAPVFASVHGGLSRFVSTVADASGARARLGTTVRALRRHGDAWQLTTGATVAPSTIEADAVVLATPSAPTARLLSDVDADVAAAVGSLEYASVVLVTLVLPAQTPLPSLSGFLTPAGSGSAVKAATFVTTKWPHLAGDVVVVRASLGRRGDADVLRHTDAGLISLVRGELPALAGVALPEPLAARVNRWGGALPQYGVGHVARTAQARTALPATLALAGAAFDGVGIAACVRSGRNAAELVWSQLYG